MTPEHKIHDLKVCLGAELKTEVLRIAALPFSANWFPESPPDKVFERAMKLYSQLQQLHAIVQHARIIDEVNAAAHEAKGGVR